MKTKLFGFWHYDKFPYLLGAPGRVLEKPASVAGWFEPDGYGGHAFQVVTMPLKEGREVKRNLEVLEHQYNLATEALRLGFEARLKALLPGDLWRKATRGGQ